MIKGSLVVDRGLRGIRVERLLEVRHKLRDEGSLGAEPEAGEDRPLLKGEETLEAGKLYPSSQDDSRRYYLPAYRIARKSMPGDTEQYWDVKLAYAPDDETGVHGTLTIELEWDVPEWTEGELRQIDHQVVLTLRHRTLYKDRDGQQAFSDHEETVELQPPSSTGNRATSVTSFMTKEQFGTVYEAMRDPDRETKLHLAINARVGVETWQQVLVNKPRDRDQIKALDHKRALFSSVLDKPLLDRFRRERGRTLSAAHTLRLADRGPIGRDARDNDREVDAARTLLLDGSAISRVPSLSGLRLGGSAPTLARGRVGAINPMLLRGAARRTPRVAAPTVTARLRATPTTPVAATPPPAAPAPASPSPSPRPTLDPRITLTPDAIRLRPTPTTTPTASPSPTTTTPTISATPPRLTHGLVRPTVLPITAGAGPQLSPALRTLSASTLSQVVTRGVDLRTMAKKSGLTLNGRKVVPLNLALKADPTDPKPAVVDTDIENAQALPFHFDPADRHAGFVYTSFEPPEPHLLEAQLVNGTTRVFYQDNLMRDLVYIPPDEFRLVRDETAPFSPSMLFLADEFGSVDGDDDAGAAEIVFKIAVVYRLEPWIDPELITRIKKQLKDEFGIAARVAPIAPREAALELDFHDLPGVAQVRDEASIDPLKGISDTLELDGDSFKAFWQMLLPRASGSGGGGNNRPDGGEGAILGKVKWRLLDGTPHDTDVRMSLDADGADVLDVVYQGRQGGPRGAHTLLLRNRIESPVVIDGSSFHAQVFEGGIVASPESPESFPVTVLQPQQSTTVRYRLTAPDDADPPTEVPLSPLIVARPQINPNAVLSQLMVKKGFESLGFQLEVKAASGVFEPVESKKPLTGLKVEFDDGTEVVLTPEMPQQEAALVGRLIDQLSGRTETAHRYYYRVTNLHLDGEGIRGPLQEGLEDGQPLVVAPFQLEEDLGLFA